jgi:ADP-ribosylglycohydrolase
VGCLLGGAIGDALGAPVEFMSWREIERRFGPNGIRTFASAYGGKGMITDDTQMTLFTAEGLIRSEHRLSDRGLANVDGVVHRAYLRWLSTQVRGSRDVPWDPEIGEDVSGWLIAQEFLHARRAPGNTCMGALLSGKVGTPDKPLNDSKGCGGVMRVAPVGLVASDPFDLGCRVAAITHGHPSGWLAAGAFAQIIAAVIHGDSIRAAVEAALERCRSADGGAEVVRALEASLALVDEGMAPTPERVELLGGGWVAEEALAISVYGALSATSPADAMANAVNHGGDSDSTGSITGNILGAALGVQWLETELLGELEGRSVIEQLAGDLYDAFIDDSGFGITSDRYPPGSPGPRCSGDRPTAGGGIGTHRFADPGRE